MDRNLRANQTLWDAWTELNKDSDFYDLEGFKQGKTSLREVELAELGDVAGRSLLHLQCHFGLDTLSWARMGARATGVDLSPKAIALARSLSEELNIPARFIASDLFEAAQRLDERFDIVYTSYGVICWMSDIRRWARLVHDFLKPGGVFYMVEFHPLVRMLDERGRLAHPYFHGDEPERFVETGSYANPDAGVAQECFEWAHSLGDVVSALIAAGLRLDFLREFPYSVYDCWPNLKETEPGRFVFRPPDAADDFEPKAIPLMFSVMARRP